MKKFRLKNFKTIILFSLIGIMLIPAVITIGQSPQQKGEVQQQAIKNFADKDLQHFVDTYIKANELQEKHHAKIMQALEDAKIDIEKYNELLSSQLNPDEKASSVEEMTAFNEAHNTITKVQEAAQVEIGNFIEEEMGINKYQEIIFAYQQNEDVQKKVDALLESLLGE